MDFILIRESNFYELSNEFLELDSYNLEFGNKRLENAILVSDASIIYPLFIKVIVVSKYKKKLKSLFDEFIETENGSDDDKNRVLSHIEKFEAELNGQAKMYLDSLYLTELKMKTSVLKSQLSVKSNYADFRKNFRGKI